MPNKFILSLLTAALLVTSSEASLSVASAAQQTNARDQATYKAKKIFAKTYAHTPIASIRTDDLDGDGRYETLILTESGSLFLVNVKGYVLLIQTGIVSDEFFDAPTIKTFHVSPQEKQTAVTFEVGPSNTIMNVYRLQGGTLVKTFEVMGDQGVWIDKKGRIHQDWKHYREQGGWDLAHAVYTWSPAKQKYVGSGQLP
ncbi:hypothetical protein B9G55_18300 [Saccharibacillus sp. O16]|nr:hypothetical protein B9G55_18300 [Saccharibacillus sp. O16]